MAPQENWPQNPVHSHQDCHLNKLWLKSFASNNYRNGFVSRIKDCYYNSNNFVTFCLLILGFIVFLMEYGKFARDFIV